MGIWHPVPEVVFARPTVRTRLSRSTWPQVNPVISPLRIAVSRATRMISDAIHQRTFFAAASSRLRSRSGESALPTSFFSSNRGTLGVPNQTEWVLHTKVTGTVTAQSIR